MMTYSQNEGKFSQCPDEIIIGNYSIPERGKSWIIDISVRDSGKTGVKYLWKVDKGEIISGQGTSKIKVSIKDYDNLMETSVRIEGLSESCQSEISEKVIIPHKGYHPILFDSYGKISRKKELERIGKFYKELVKDEEDFGVIILNSDNSGDLITRLNNLNDFLLSNNYDKSRLIILISDTQDEQSKLWIGSAGMPDCENCKQINLATYIQDVQNLIDKGLIFEETDNFEEN